MTFITRALAFIQENLLLAAHFTLDDDDALLERGVIDSMGERKAVSSLKSEFGVVPPEEKITEATQATRRAFARLVTSRVGVSFR